MNEQVVVVQVFIQVAFLFCEVGRERRVEQGGAPGRQYGISYLEHTQTHTLLGVAVRTRLSSCGNDEVTETLFLFANNLRLVT